MIRMYENKTMDCSEHRGGRETIAVCAPEFLRPSMTFIYRQLLGACSDFDPIVLTRSVKNRERFPFGCIIVRRRSIAERIYARAVASLCRRYSEPTKREVKEWARELEQRRVKLIHAHFGYSGIEFLPVAQALDVPLVVTLHGVDASAMLFDDVYRRSLRSLLERATIIAVSREMVGRIASLGLPTHNIRVHYIGVPVREFFFVPRVAPICRVQAGCAVRLLQVSNFVEKKGHYYTLHAFREFKKNFPNAVLTLAGDGVLCQEIRDLGRQLGLAESIIFPGGVDTQGVQRLMYESDIFVHHSVTTGDGDSEGIPTVLMEAMATGIPVVSTRHGGIPELIVHGESGFLVKERDVEEYVRQLNNALHAGAVVTTAARDVVQDRFNIERQNCKLIAIYRSLINVPTT